MTAELTAALTVIERKAIAPLKRVMAARPKDFSHTNHAAWADRLREVETQAARALGAIGAEVAWGTGHGKIGLLGITARSGSGLLAALERWRGHAKIKLEKENRRVRP